MANQYGLTKHVKSDSAQYLKSWLGSLKESPDFLKTVLGDVKRSTGLINQRLEAIRLEMDKGEEADYSQFRPEGVTGAAEAKTEQAQAAKDVEPEEERHFGRSR